MKGVEAETERGQRKAERKRGQKKMEEAIHEQPDGVGKSWL